MNLSIESRKWLNSGLPGRLHRWVKDEHAVGLDVHDGQIVASHFIEQNGELALNTLAAERVDPSLSDKELARCIQSFWKKNKLPSRTVCTCLHTPSLIVRSFSYTNVLPDELHRVLALEAEEALQLPLAEISLSWQLNPETGSEISGALIAAPRKMVHSHIKLIQAAGLFPVNVEISGSSIINLYDFMNENTEDSPVCLINLTSQMAGIVILSGGANYPRIVYSGSENGWEENLNYLIENMESALLQYQLKTTGDPISKLLLTGASLRDEAMARMVEVMSIPVERWDLTSENKMTRLLHLESMELPNGIETFNLATSLGLGLRHPKREL